MREWDMVNPEAGRSYILSQEEWVNRQRKQRVEEFAPPVYSYNKKNKGNSYHNFQTKASTSEDFEKEGMKREERKSEFAPPSTYEYYGPSSSSHKKRFKPNYKSTEEAVAKGLSNLRKMTDI